MQTESAGEVETGSKAKTWLVLEEVVVEAVQEELRAAGGDSGGDDGEPELEEGAFYIQFGSSRGILFSFFFSF
ncbi:hypothetical protein L484_009132 [Morus notabilis]|uniref:Uncharacterized protein n=1 Tax=Morus notabilis TaxID=981085 RepID=W9RG46_9ROSA|nr:hypothetical protein L484_009132 [Morus notabilis]